MSKEPRPTKFPDINATTVFVNIVPGVDVDKGITTISLGHERMVMRHGAPITEQVVVVRIAMETSKAEGLANAVLKSIAMSRSGSGSKEIN